MLDPQPIQLVQPALLIRHARRSTAMNTLSQDLARLRLARAL